MASSPSSSAAPVPPRIHIPRDESVHAPSAIATTTAEGSPRVYSLAKSFSERLAALSPRNMKMAPPSSLALGPTAAGGSGGGSAPGSGANSPRLKHGGGTASGAATPTRTILQRFHTAPSSPMGLRSPSSYRTTMGSCVSD